MRLAIVTDAWEPQVNGVVHSLKRVTSELERFGDAVSIIHPGMYRTIPCPTYPEIRLAVTSWRKIATDLDAAEPQFIHIATEGPLGLLARRICLKQRQAYTTSYHTRFPEYVAARLSVGKEWTYRLVRKFHNGGVGWHGCDRVIGERAGGAWLQEPDEMVARCR